MSAAETPADESPAGCGFKNRLRPTRMGGGVRYVACRSEATVTMTRNGETVDACPFHATQARSAGWTEAGR